MFFAIEMLLSTLLLFSALLVIPYKIKKREMIFLFGLCYIILYIGYQVVGILTNTLGVFTFLAIIIFYTKKFFINIYLILYNYLFFVMLNNIHVGFLLKINNYIFNNQQKILIFEIYFILFYYCIAYFVGKNMNEKYIYLYDISLLNKNKKIFLSSLLCGAFIIYQLLIFKWSNSINKQEVIINNIIIASVSFMFLFSAILYFYKKIYNYENKIDNIVDKIIGLNNNQIKELENIIEQEENDNNKILKQLIKLKNGDKNKNN